MTREQTLPTVSWKEVRFEYRGHRENGPAILWIEEAGVDRAPNDLKAILRQTVYPDAYSPRRSEFRVSGYVEIMPLPIDGSAEFLSGDAAAVSEFVLQATRYDLYSVDIITDNYRSTPVVPELAMYERTGEREFDFRIIFDHEKPSLGQITDRMPIRARLVYSLP